MIKKIKEPIPSLEKAASMALNTVYFEHQQKAKLFKINANITENVELRMTHFTEKCSQSMDKSNSSKESYEAELTDCLLNNEMALRRSFIEQKCSGSLKNNSKIQPSVDPSRLVIVKYRFVIKLFYGITEDKI